MLISMATAEDAGGVPSRARGRMLRAGIHRRVIAAGLLVAIAGLALCSFVSGTAEASSKKTEALQTSSPTTTASGRRGSIRR